MIRELISDQFEFMDFNSFYLLSLMTCLIRQLNTVPPMDKENIIETFASNHLAIWDPYERFMLYTRQGKLVYVILCSKY